MYGPNLTPRIRRMVRNGISQACGFSSSIQNHELIVDFARHYLHLVRLVIVGGRVMVRLTSKAIIEAFDIPIHQKIKYV